MVKTNSIKAWFLAARPVTLSAAAVPVMLGVALAYKDSSANCQWVPTLLCLLFAWIMQIDSNFVNDFFDFKHGNDDETRLGPKRACAEGWITMKAMKWGIISTTLLGCIIGLPLAFYGGKEMIIVGICCVLFCFLYTTKLSYLGLGDLLVLLFFGIVPVCCTYYLVMPEGMQTVSAEAILTSIACGLVVDTLLILNNYRDYDNDIKAGKKTLIVHIGKKNGEREDPTECEKCGCKHLTREEDVLDTWFSSALWPFSTMGWPDKDAADLNYWYPTSVMVTGYDIIFFWVARMIFSGMEQMKKEPFKTVFIHGLVRDDKGRKMSKSLGNGIDPLEMADKYGADALRFNLITGNSPGNDMRFYVEKCEAMRNFCNKIWNASRFVMMNLTIDHVELPEKLELEDKWILSKLNTLIREVTDNMDAFELGVASAKIYDFIWDNYCDWFIELTKNRLNSDDQTTRENAQNVLCYVLIETLKLLHPFMPFITEEIWQALPHEGEFLMLSKWPEYNEKFSFPAEEEAMQTVIEAITAIRARRNEMNVAPSKKVHYTVATAHADTFSAGIPFFTRLASASDVTIVPADAAIDADGKVEVDTHAARIFMPLAELVDFEKELARIAKEKASAEKQLAGIENKLKNEGFLAKAPEAVVNGARADAEKLKALIEKLDASAAAMKK